MAVLRLLASVLLVLGLAGLVVGATEHDSRARDEARRALEPTTTHEAGPAGDESVNFSLLEITDCGGFGDLIPSVPGSIVAILAGALLVVGSVAVETRREA